LTRRVVSERPLVDDQLKAILSEIQARLVAFENQGAWLRHLRQNKLPLVLPLPLWQCPSSEAVFCRALLKGRQTLFSNL
jgi:hypothetical protein